MLKFSFYKLLNASFTETHRKINRLFLKFQKMKKATKIKKQDASVVTDSYVGHLPLH